MGGRKAPKVGLGTVKRRPCGAPAPMRSGLSGAKHDLHKTEDQTNGRDARAM